MPESNFFRRIEEKNVSCEVELMQWSPRMDLIALALNSGEVALHRLSWQKVWTLRPREDVADAQVTALAWRPDGKVLAVGYESGCVVLVDVEDANIIHENHFNRTGKLDLSRGSNFSSPTGFDPLSPPPNVAVTCLSWIQASLSLDDDDVFHSSSSSSSSSALKEEDPEDASTAWTENSLLRDDAGKFLQKLPSLAKNQGNLATKKEAPPENVEDGKKIKDQKGLNVLTVGFGRNMIQMLAFGLSPMGNKEIELSGTDTRVNRINSVYLSQDLRSLSVVVEIETASADAPSTSSGAGTLHHHSTLSHQLFTYDTSVLVQRHREIRVLAQRYGQILALQEYMDETLKLMKEAWEDILQDMDDKLLMFAEEKRRSGGGSLGVDFLELLLFGIASDELNSFLLHNLTAKGLKKLAHSIESSYINIQKLVLKNLQTVCQSLVYHLSDLYGMSKCYDRFGQLGLEQDACLQTLHVAGGCFLKACDLQQAIDSSLKNFKAFFSWLYVAIQRLSDETVPAELGKMSMSDINFVAEFLKENFCYDLEEEVKSPASASKGEVKGRFRLERVGQYLKDEPLSFPTPEKNSIWGAFLEFLGPEDAARLMSSPLIFPSFGSHSIMTLNERLLDSFHSALMVPGVRIGAWFSLCSAAQLYSLPDPSSGFKPLFSHWSDPAQHLNFFAFKNPSGDSMSFLKQTTSLVPSSPELSVLFSVVRFGSATTEGNESLNASLSSPCSSSSTSSSSSSSPSSLMKIVDVRAYDRDSLTLLLQDPKSDGVPCLRQFHCGEVLNHLACLSAKPSASIVLPPASASSSFTAVARVIRTLRLPIYNEEYCVKLSLGGGGGGGGAGGCGGGSQAFATKRLNNLKAEMIAVSGSRKVCCVLFTSKRRVCLFLTDVLDEEEEDEDEGEEEEGGVEDEGDGDAEEEREEEGGEGNGEEGGEEETDSGMMGNSELEDDAGDHESDKENDAVE